MHVLLDADEAVLRDRIDADEVESAARSWRVDHLRRYADARRWLTDRADVVVDTTELAPKLVAAEVLAAAAPRI